MKSDCVVCKTGTMRPGPTTLTVERGKLTLVLKGIPARVCSTCGEAYIDEATMKKIEAKVEQLERAGTQVAVQDYAA